MIRRALVAAALMMPGAVAAMAPDRDAGALAAELYDQAFARALHRQFVVDVADQLEAQTRQQVEVVLGSQSRIQACEGLEQALEALVQDGIRPALEQAHAHPATRDAMIAFLAGSVPVARLRALLVQARVGTGQDLLWLQVFQDEATRQRFDETIAASPLNMRTNEEAHARLLAASVPLAPTVQRCVDAGAQ